MNEKEYRIIFAEKLKAKRKSAGLTQKKLGLMMGLSETSADRMIQRWEYHTGLPDLIRAQQLSQALGCTIEELLPDPDQINESIKEPLV